MEAILLIDFGSTNTKVTAVDPAEKTLRGTAAAYTTVETDIGEGLEEALELLRKETGPVSFTRRFACSSAAGGLRMIASGLVPSLTAEAARLAALGAGAKIAGVYSYELTGEDLAEIVRIKPDIFLLTGGVDGGNKECILHNAHMLASLGAPGPFPVLIAGNRSAQAGCAAALAGWDVIRCPNVLPKLGTLNVEPAQAEIRRLFLERIIHARGLSRERELVSGILMPTPAAVKRALELLSAGTAGEAGLGELAAVDLGGATTDVYSAASGMPRVDAILKGIPEPFSKRTVEGDIGMRYSAAGVLEAAGPERLAALSGLAAGDIPGMVARLAANPGVLPVTAEDAGLDFALAAAAVETAMDRHAGTIEEVYTPAGPAFVQTGKDLTGVERLILTGGAAIHSREAKKTARYALFTAAKAASLKPSPNSAIFIDTSYILAAMGLLAETQPGAALSIMKKEIKNHGTCE
ncbi:MAG: glutamate mutase L [Spirochaetaceae bacterium]|jgi:uncharacterized protein (TIGR01319 family)|nr:glutamate mutase L [Spirochaetaceae bacterium]